DASVDLVLCTEVLEHLLEPGPFLGQAFRCLRPGGRLLLTVPFSARWHYVPYDYWRYTPSSLHPLLGSTGLGLGQGYPPGNQVTVACYKVMALILPFLFPQDGSRVSAWLRRSVGLLLAPALVGLAVVGNLSLRSGRGGDDCLGYTVLARKPSAIV